MKIDKLRRGFTLIELIVVMAIFLVIAVITMPQIMNMVYRARIEGTMREAVVLLRAVRYEAIKRNCYGVVMIDPAQRTIIAFVDRNRNGLFETGITPPDVLVGRIDLPSRLEFKNAAGNAGLASVEGLVNPDVPSTLPDKQVMYREDGSVLSTGAIRIADPRGNVLEVNVSPQVSGKVQIRKYQGTQYVAKGDVKEWTYQ
jgi:prepilin-type N-terminal cleavage/methylation domain-containing protein